MATTPLIRNAIWSYVQSSPAPIAGPQPRLARGRGRTGRHAAPGTGPMLPSYVSEPDYHPTPFAYNPRNRSTFLRRIPMTINTGDDGVEVVGTYRAHDVTIGQRMGGQERAAANWQEMAFPPDFRNLLEWQQIQKYRALSETLAARPLARSDYFLGYRLDPSTAAQFGGFNGLGVMGSQ